MTDAPKIDPTKTHVVLEHKHDRPLVACRFDPTGRYVFFGAEDNLVHRFDLKTKSVTPFAAHESWVRALGFSPDGNTLYTGGYDGRLICWPAAARESEAPAEPLPTIAATADKPEPIRVVEAHQGWLRALAVSPSGEQIATCGNDNLVKLWDAADGRLVAEFAGHASHVYNVAFHPTAETLVSCDLKGVLKEWDIASGKLNRDLAPAAALYKYDTTFRADIGGARSIAFSADGKQLAISGITNVTNAFAGIGNPAIELLDMAEGKLALHLEAKEKLNGVAWGVAHHPAGFWIGLAGGGGGGWLYFFNAGEANEHFKLKLPNDGRDLALSPDKTQVAVAHFDKSLRIYTLHDS
jgi:WD40 repeat protein